MADLEDEVVDAAVCVVLLLKWYGRPEAHIELERPLSIPPAILKVLILPHQEISSIDEGNACSEVYIHSTERSIVVDLLDVV